MENASKALLMAAGVLIGILVLSLAVYLFVTFGSSSAQMHGKIAEDQLNQFNAKFTSYEEKKGLTVYDVITVANLANENNRYYGFTTQKNTTDLNSNDSYIVVIFNHRHIELWKNEDYTKLIEEEISNAELLNSNKELTKYKCKVTINQTTRRVSAVTF